MFNYYASSKSLAGGGVKKFDSPAFVFCRAGKESRGKNAKLVARWVMLQLAMLYHLGFQAMCCKPAGKEGRNHSRVVRMKKIQLFEIDFFRRKATTCCISTFDQWFRVAINVDSILLFVEKTNHDARFNLCSGLEPPRAFSLDSS